MHENDLIWRQLTFLRSEAKVTMVIYLRLQLCGRRRHQGVQSHPSGLTDIEYQFHSTANHGLLPNELVLVYQHEKPRWHSTLI